jgi:integrase/recombinase XerD
MTDEAISPLRRRLIEDMAIRRLGPKTRLHYIRHVKRFADFVGRSVGKATTEDVHRYQLWLASIGTTVPTVNVSATALRFFFKVTLRRHDLAEGVVSTRKPRCLPKPARLALVAAMRELLTILNALLRDRKPWAPAHS